MLSSNLEYLTICNSKYILHLSNNIPEHYRRCHGDGCDYEERNVLEDINDRGGGGGLQLLREHLLHLLLGDVAVHNGEILRVFLQQLGVLAILGKVEKLRRHDDVVSRERRPGGHSVGGHDGVVSLETLEIVIIAGRRRRQIVARLHLGVTCVQGE